ncbi:hypothetical protein TELCIR_24986, partial [Teladorsagia circumcincta]
MDGEKLQYLMFADDIVLIGNDPRELETSLEILSNASRSIGLEMHPEKTKWMKNNFTRDYCLHMKGSVIEEVPSYAYLGQAITMDNDLTVEIGRPVRQVGQHSINTVMFSLMSGLTLKSEPEYSTPTSYRLWCMEVKHGAWSTIIDEERRLASTQRAMERAMCTVTLMHKIPAREIRRRTSVKD